MGEGAYRQQQQQQAAAMPPPPHLQRAQQEDECCLVEGIRADGVVVAVKCDEVLQGVGASVLDLCHEVEVGLPSLEVENQKNGRSRLCAGEGAGCPARPPNTPTPSGSAAVPPLPTHPPTPAPTHLVACIGLEQPLAVVLAHEGVVPGMAKERGDKALAHMVQRRHRLDVEPCPLLHSTLQHLQSHLCVEGWGVGPGSEATALRFPAISASLCEGAGWDGVVQGWCGVGRGGAGVGWGGVRWGWVGSGGVGWWVRWVLGQRHCPDVEPHPLSIPRLQATSPSAGAACHLVPPHSPSAGPWAPACAAPPPAPASGR